MRDAGLMPVLLALRQANYSAHGARLEELAVHTDKRIQALNLRETRSESVAQGRDL